MTSRDVVNILQRRLRPLKVGHTGTLDPLASGVLVLTIGKATRLTEYVQRMKKSYVGQFRFGFTSDTEDIEGNVAEAAAAHPLDIAVIRNVLPKFVGKIEQIPPAFSALKVKGRRAYDLARAGQEVELKARPVVIYSLSLVAYEYPNLELSIECGSGTYIRSLGRDIARRLGTEAIMTALNRTAIGRFALKDAVDASQLAHVDLDLHVQPLRTAVDELVQVEVSHNDVIRLGHGRAIECQSSAFPDDEPAEIAAIGPEGELVAILVKRTDGYGPIKSFVSSA
jgi:tRNA pseudouridine55 synthase